MYRFTLLLLLLLADFIVSGQSSDIVEQDSIFLPVHRANTGRITFMGKVIPIEKYTETDFLTAFALKEKTDLNIRVFMAHSLTNSLHRLSPATTVDELTKNGNYQFTFYVDNSKLYVENLNAGAGNAATKNQKTVFRVPLISSTDEDSWGRFLWNRFLANGGQEALIAGEHTLRLEIRPYLATPGATEVLTGDLIASGQLQVIVPEKKLSAKQLQLQAIKPDSGWELSPEKIDTAKLTQLNRKIGEEAYKNITSIIVIRDGKLLVEEYFNGATRKTLHDTRSVGKSFTSTLIGMAIRDGFIKSEEERLNTFYDLRSFANYSPAKDSITLKSLMTMSSSFDGSDQNTQSAGHEDNMYPTDNWVHFALDLPVDSTKTAAPRWDYFTAGVVVLGDVLQQTVPGGLEAYADKQLFKPLGITRHKWVFTPQKVPSTAGGLQLRALDFARFGQLYQQKGQWNGQQVLPQEWVAKSLSKQSVIGNGEYYGYLFWNKTYHVNGVDYEAWYCSGNGGNKIVIFKNTPLVFVITATAYNTPYGQKQADAIIQEYLLPAVAGKL